MTETKCIYRQNTYSINSLSRSELYTEDRDGQQRRPLMQCKDSYKAILTVNSEGFKITAGQSGEVLRRGTDKDVFRIYDSLLFDPEPLLVRDTLAGVEMPFPDYENKYGFNRVDRTEKAKFKLYAIQTERETALGIEHYRGLNTVWIASIYFSYPMNGKEIADYAAGVIFEKLEANQTASVNAVGVPKDMRHPYVKIYKHEDDKKYDMVRELAEDAVERKETISEVFDEPDDEGAIAENDNERTTTTV